MRPDNSTNKTDEEQRVRRREQRNCRISDKDGMDKRSERRPKLDMFKIGCTRQKEIEEEMKKNRECEHCCI